MKKKNDGSARSRKAGQIEQDNMTLKITQLAGRLFGAKSVQVEVEPILKKINVKRLN